MSDINLSSYKVTDDFFGAPYIDVDECQLSYNPLQMALTWEALATRDASLLSQALDRQRKERGEGRPTHANDGRLRPEPRARTRLALLVRRIVAQPVDGQKHFIHADIEQRVRMLPVIAN